MEFDREVDSIRRKSKKSKKSKMKKRKKSRKAKRKKRSHPRELSSKSRKGDGVSSSQSGRRANVYKMVLSINYPRKRFPKKKLLK